MNRETSELSNILLGYEVKQIPLKLEIFTLTLSTSPRSVNLGVLFIDKFIN